MTIPTLHIFTQRMFALIFAIGAMAVYPLESQINTNTEPIRIDSQKDIHKDGSKETIKDVTKEHIRPESTRTSDSNRTERRAGRQLVRELQNDIDGLLRSRDFTNSHIGICVVSADNGEYLYRENEQKNFIPASTQKLFTTSAALDFLGKDFRYCTRLYLDGIVDKNGEYVGNIIIRGSGDPTWSEYFNTNTQVIFDKWITKLDSLGIVSIKGNIIGDDSYFDNEYYAPGWMWDDMAYPFSAQVSALSSGDNKIDFVILPGAIAGEPARIMMKQDNRFLRVINSVITVNSSEPAEVVPIKNYGSDVIELRGKIPISGKSERDPFMLSVTIDNPTQYTVNLFKQVVESHRIKVRGAALTIDNWNERINYTQLEPLCEYFSPTLLQISNVINKQSHNLCAESILKTLGKETSGVGSFAKGVEYVKKYLVKNAINTDDMTIVDGSGLSRLNLCSPQKQTQLLWAILRSDKKGEFQSTLAVPGEIGTMRTRTVGTQAEKRLKAKTGTMNSVSTLAGYVTTRDGETFCFSIMMNNFSVPESVARNLQDLICMRLASFSRKG